MQNSISATYGQRSPSTPILRCRNATQTSVVLEWDPIQLATAELRSLFLFRNGNKAGNIPRPLEVTSTKISGLAIDTEYVIHLILRTSAGQYSSEKLHVRTHKMTDLSGITVTPGVLPAPLRYSLSGAVERIGGKLVETVRIDTTHFVCTEGRGREWERAVEMNIPVVRPEWVEGCEREGRIVGVRGYYLNADPRLRQVGQGVGMQGGAGPSRRTESQTSIKRMPPTAQQQLGENGSKAHNGPSGSYQPNTATTDPSTGVSPMTTGRLEVMREPPEPPAKDRRPESAVSSAGSTPAQLAADTNSDEEEKGIPHGAPRQRQLVKNAFDNARQTITGEVPLSPGNLVDDDEDERKTKGRQPSDGGSFSEVAL